MKRWAALLCTIALMALIFALSAQPGAESFSLSQAALSAAEDTGVSAFIPAWFDPRSYANIRKWAHVCLYAVLGVSMAVTVHLWICRHAAVQASLAAALCLLYAVGDEIHQYFVPGRAALWQDVFIDAAGFVPGIAAVYLFFWLRAKHQPKNH